jgi:hypothetical protein
LRGTRLHWCLHQVSEWDDYYMLNVTYVERRSLVSDRGHVSFNVRVTPIRANSVGPLFRQASECSSAHSSDRSRLILDFNVTRSVNTSAWRRNWSAIIGGWADMVETTVT